MKFFISSEQYSGFFRIPGQVNAGDRLSAIAQKYQDRGLTKFLGDTYANYYVLKSERVSTDTFQVRASSVRYLHFQGNGYLIVMGVSDQLWRLDDKGTNVVDLKVVSSDMSIVGGTGDFQKSFVGSYKVKTIDVNTHIGTIHLDNSLRWLVSIHYIFGGLLLLILLMWLSKRK